ncbi:unnamed protein product [marine sediment metagenome]|uniref:Ubiquitin Mut7-C domain-containing protein n=1 Tax=marine sediment metagenome TaxID=412755 RepID=X0TWQ1_9ZZZZ
MRDLTKVYLFGSLEKAFGDNYELPVQVDLKIPTPITEVLISLKIPTELVHLAMVNYRAVPKSSKIHSGDRLSLFPKEYPIFADWKDFRF